VGTFGGSSRSSTEGIRLGICTDNDFYVTSSHFPSLLAPIPSKTPTYVHSLLLYWLRFIVKRW
jgi:hypothetical protein